MVVDFDCYTNKLYKIRRGSKKIIWPELVIVPLANISLGGPGGTVWTTNRLS